VIDQAEELFSLCREGKQRHQFLADFGSGTRWSNRRARFHILLTLRSDFEPQFRNSVLEHHFWGNDRFVIRPMNREELRVAIEAPASAKVIYFDPPELVDRLIDEVNDMPGALPLLSFTLRELFLKYLRTASTRSNRAITEADYEELGGIKQALVNRADEEYQVLVEQDSAYEDTVRHVMLRMVATGGTGNTRRQVLLSELDYAESEGTRVKEVLTQYKQARLLVSDTTAEDQPYVEPAHDALVEGWPRLLQWLESGTAGESLGQQRKGLFRWLNNLGTKDKEASLDEREKLLLQRRLTPAANDWQREQKTEYLWHADARLPLLKQIRAKEPDWFNRKEGEFVQHSLGRKRFNVGLRWLLMTSLLAASVLTGLAIFRAQQEAIAQRQEAKRQEDLAKKEANRSFAGELAGQSQLVQEEDPNLLELSGLLAVEAAQRFINLENTSLQADRAIRKSLSLLPTLVRRIDLTPYTTEPSSEEVIAYNFTGDEEALLLFDGSQLLFMDADSEDKDNISIGLSDNQKIELVSISYQGKYIALAIEDEGIALIDLNKVSNQLLNLHQKNVREIAFSPDNKYILIQSEDEHQIWEIGENQALIRPLNLSEVSFSPDGKYVAGYNLENASKNVIDLDSGETVLSVPDIPGTSFYVLSDDSTLFATGYSDNTGAEIWTIQSQEKIFSLPASQTGYLTEINLTSNGKYLLLGNRTGEVSIWDTQDGSRITTVEAEESADWIRQIEIDSRDELMAVVVDNFVRIYHIPSGQEMKRIVYKNEIEIKNIIFSPDSYLIVVENLYSDGLSQSSTHNLDIWKISDSPFSEFGNAELEAISPSGGNLLISHKDSKDSFELSLSSYQNPMQDRLSLGSFPGFLRAEFSYSGDYLAVVVREDDHALIQVFDTNNLQKINEIRHNFGVDIIGFSEEEDKLLISEFNKYYVYEILGSSLEPSTGEIAFQPLGFYNNFSVSLIGETESNSDLLLFESVLDDSKSLKFSATSVPAKVWDFEVSSSKEKFAISGGSVGASGNNFSDGYVRVWSTKTQEIVFSIDSEMPIFSVYLSPNGQYIAWDSRIWDLEEGQEIARFEESRVLGFVSDSEVLISRVSESPDYVRNLEIHSLEIAKAKNEVCSRLPRGFTDEEWQQYFGDRPYRNVCSEQFSSAPQNSQSQVPDFDILPSISRLDLSDLNLILEDHRVFYQLHNQTADWDVQGALNSLVVLQTSEDPCVASFATEFTNTLNLQGKEAFRHINPIKEELNETQGCTLPLVPFDFSPLSSD
jgi:WD40 repeat protein